VIGRLDVIVMLFLVGPPCLYSEQSRPAPRPPLTLIECDMAGVPIEIRTRAKGETIRIFDSAGVDVVWVDVGPGCKVPSIERSFIVVIIHEPPEAWNKRRAAGFAPIRTGAHRRAYVFYDRVVAAAKASTTNHVLESTGIILGHVVAHELGHLLLPGDAHSINGIMRNQWNNRLSEEAAAGRLVFTPDQSKLIRRELQAN
jgi:hypothetical protein